MVFKACRRADNLQPLGCDPEAVPQSSNQQRHLGTGSASIEVSLVKNEHKGLSGIVLEPLPRRVEDRPFQRTHEHVLEHRVVRYEKVRRLCLHFMACK